MQSQSMSEAKFDVQARWQVSKHIRSHYFNNLGATELLCTLATIMQAHSVLQQLLQ